MAVQKAIRAMATGDSCRSAENLSARYPVIETPENIRAAEIAIR